MNAVGALPTEERVMKMNNFQWLWYYHNLMEEKEKQQKRQDSTVDYLTFFINADLAKAVQEKKNLDVGKETKKRNQLNGNETYNDEFEKEFGKYFENKDNFIELPNSSGLTVNESEDEFFERAMKMQEFILDNPDNAFIQPLPKAKRVSKPKMTEEEIIKFSLENNQDMIFTPDSI